MSTLNLGVVRQFLTGGTSFEEIARLQRFGTHGTSIRRAHEPIDKVLVAWALVLAKPEHFGFEYHNDELIGDLDDALLRMYRGDNCLVSFSYDARLHTTTRNAHGKRTRKLTLPQEFIDLVREHIDNPEGGIAQYFEEETTTAPAKTVAPEVVTTVKEVIVPSGEGRILAEEVRRQQHAMCRGRVKTAVLTEFLTGRSPVKKEKSDRSRSPLSRTNRVIITWALILAQPEHFEFVLEDGELVGSAPMLMNVFGFDTSIGQASSGAGLHCRKKGSLRIRATLPRSIIELVHKHIDNPEGGIAQYYKNEGLDVPTTLDPRVAEAALADEEKTGVPIIETAGATPKTTVPAEASDDILTDPEVMAAAEDIVARLRKLHSESVLHAIKHLL